MIGIRKINSSPEFHKMLATEEIMVVLQLSSTSTPQWLEKWILENTYSSVLLVANEHPFSWQWINESLNGHDSGCPPLLALAWLKNGRVAEVYPEPQPMDSRLLSQKNAAHFTANLKGDSATIDPASPIDSALLEILCCPETHQKLSLASRQVLEQINDAQASRRLKNRSGQLVMEPLNDGLIRADGRYLYPFRRNVPVMLVAEAIPLS